MEFTIFTYTIKHLVYTPPPPAKKKLCITIVFDFFGDDCNTQENWKQWLCKILGGGGGDNVHYGLRESINKLNEVLSFVMEK